VEYFSRIETVFQGCDNKDNKWLAGGLECLVAVQYLILKKKLNFSPERYTPEKRDSAYNKIAKSLRIYGHELQNYNKAVGCFIKFSHFFKKMNMHAYFHRMLGENLSMLVHPKASIIHKISCADYAAQFGCYRTSAYLLYNAHEQIRQNVATNLLNPNSASIQRSEIVLMMVWVLGLLQSSEHIQNILPHCSAKPLVNRPIINFILNALHSLNFCMDKRYCLSLIYLLSLMISDKEKEKLWETIVNCTPNLEGEHIHHPLELPYFGYILAIPNSRKVQKSKVDSALTANPEASLFLYDPRKKTVAINWCSHSPELLTVYMYNPLPFAVVVDSLEVVTKNLKATSHSGKFVLRPFEQKKKIKVHIKFFDEGDLEIVGLKVWSKKLSYFLSCGSNGVADLVRNNPDLPCSVETGNQIVQKEVEMQNFSKIEVFSAIPDLKATMVKDVDELLSLGETINFLIKFQNCSEFEACLQNTKVSIEFENGKPLICRHR